MRTIEYIRYELHGDPEQRKAELATFVYDIPYLSACGIFPPFHILNQIFETGGSEGGMSPGATWEPFSISEEEYRLLAKALVKLDPDSLQDTARYTFVNFEFDPEFDHLPDWDAWLTKICNKHRDAYHTRRSGD